MKMKTKNLKLFGIVAMAALILTFTSCKKYKLNRDTTTSEDQAVAESITNDLFDNVDDAAKQNDDAIGKTGITSSLSTCAVITVDTTAGTIFPATVTIDFGTGCVGNDGKTRSGIISAEITGPYRDEGTSVTITPDNYSVDGYSIEGQKVVTNMGLNVDSHSVFHIEITNVVITTPDAETIEWQSSRDREWMEGESTYLNIFDDVYHITGTGAGVNREGRPFEMEITNRLRKEIGCYWLVSGTLEIRPQDLNTITVDFGDGACDDEATVEIGNNTYIIHMH